MTLPCSGGRRGTAPPQAHPTAGFTMIELLAVVAVLGLVMVLIVGFRPQWGNTLSIRGAAAELASGLRLARSQAVARNRPVVFAIDVSAHRYRIGDAQPRALPTNISIAVLTSAGERVNGDVAAIRFNADGSSSGGRIGLADNDRRIAVGVDWLTGRVSVADVP